MGRKAHKIIAFKNKAGFSIHSNYTSFEKENPFALFHNLHYNKITTPDPHQILKFQLSQSLKEFFVLNLKHFSESSYIALKIVELPSKGVILKKIQEISSILKEYPDNDSYVLIFSETITTIARSLKNQILKLETAQNKVEIIPKAYTMYIAYIQQVKSVSNGLFKRSKKSFDEMIKKIFYGELLRPLTSVIKEFQGKTESNKVSKAIQIYNELNDIAEPKILKKNAEIDPMFMSVDEVILFIDGKSKKNTKNMISESSTSTGSRSPERLEFDDTEIDKEIDEFRDRLEETQLAQIRIRPKITDKWLDHVKNQLFVLKQTYL